jgi:hypothetical protein
MEARRRWATGVVVIVALAAGAGGGAYLWKEAFPTDSDVELRDGGLMGDAAAGARGSRGKAKSAKRKGTAGKARPRPRPTGGQAGGHGGGGQGGGGQGGGGGTNVSDDDGQDDEGIGDEGAEVFRPPFIGRGPAGPTYEAAIGSNKQEVVIGGKAAPDLTDAQLAGPMQNGGFVGECGAPDRMKVTVKVAIKMGRPAGFSVSTNPPDPDIAGCIDRYVRTFSWPSNDKMDSFTTTY